MSQAKISCALLIIEGSWLRKSEEHEDGNYPASMSWDHLSELSEHYVVYAYCAGKDGGPPCVH